MKRKKSLKVFAIIFCLILCMVAMTVNTFGYVRIDTERETALTLVFEAEKTTFSGVKFRLYYIADVSDVLDFALTEEFASSTITLQNVSADGWQKNVQILTDYIREKKIAPMTEKATGADGIVTFDGLKPGLYLVEGEPYNTGTEVYTPTSFMVNLPNLEEEIDTWDYEVVAKVKYTVTSVDLPQTGQLWWPVVFLIPGIALATAGIVILCKKNHAKTQD